MIGDLIEARLLLIRAEIHLEWMCKESRAARELVADIQKFLTLSDSFKDSCGGTAAKELTGIVSATAIKAAPKTGCGNAKPISVPSAAGIETASENEDAGAGAEASSAPEHNGAVTDPGLLIARTPFAAREDRDKPPCPPESGTHGIQVMSASESSAPTISICNPERPSIVKVRKV